MRQVLFPGCVLRQRRFELVMVSSERDQSEMEDVLDRWPEMRFVYLTKDLFILSRLLCRKCESKRFETRVVQVWKCERLAAQDEMR